MNILIINTHLTYAGWSERVQVLIREGRLPAQKVGGSYVLNEGGFKLVEIRKPGRPPKSKEEAEKSTARKRARKKDPARLLKTLS